MAILRVSLTDDMLKLISRICFTQFPSQSDWGEKQSVNWGLDFNSLYGGSYLFEDISYILGIYDQHIPGTENDPLGVKFPREVEDKMWEIHGYILSNIQYIEELVHQFTNKGGLKPGTYKCKSNEHIWEFEG